MIVAVFFFFLSLGTVWGLGYDWTDGQKYRFAVVSMVFSLLTIILQVGGFMAEISRCGGFAWIKLTFNRALINVLGIYGSDIMLSILKYKDQKLDTSDSKAGVLWKGMAAVMYYVGKVTEWAVFSDPYSGIFQTRYKTNCIWLSAESFGGEGYCELWKSAAKKLDECDPEIGARPSELDNSTDREIELVETVKVRSANFMVRHSKVGLYTDTRYYKNETPEDPEACVVEVLLYTSQGNNSGGLFHEMYGPINTKRSKVTELLVLMKLLSNDAFVVDKPPPKDMESLLHCLSFRDTLGAILQGASRVNFAMRTGMSFG